MRTITLVTCAERAIESRDMVCSRCMRVVDVKLDGVQPVDVSGVGEVISNALVPKAEEGSESWTFVACVKTVIRVGRGP